MSETYPYPEREPAQGALCVVWTRRDGIIGDGIYLGTYEPAAWRRSGVVQWMPVPAEIQMPASEAEGARNA